MVDRSVELALVFRALGDPTRQRIVELLAEGGARTVGNIASSFRMTLQGVSKHLGVLAEAGLVSRTRRGRTQICTLNAKPLHDAREWMGVYAEAWSHQFDQLDAYLREAGDQNNTPS